MNLMMDPSEMRSTTRTGDITGHEQLLARTDPAAEPILRLNVEARSPQVTCGPIVGVTRVICAAVGGSECDLDQDPR